MRLFVDGLGDRRTRRKGFLVADEAPRQQPDPESGWPPRFSNDAISWIAIVLLVVFVSVAGWFRSVFDGADLLKAGEDAAENVSAYVLFIIGLLSILAGILFGFIEARKPPPAEDGVRPLSSDPVGMVGKVIESFQGKKLSTILLSIGVVLLFLAAAGTGLIEINVGDDGAGAGADTG